MAAEKKKKSGAPKKKGGVGGGTGGAGAEGRGAKNATTTTSSEEKAAKSSRRRASAAPELSPVDDDGSSSSSEDGSGSDESVYDSADDDDEEEYDSNAEEEEEGSDDDEDDEDDDEEEFEDQGSSDDDDDRLERQAAVDEGEGGDDFSSDDDDDEIRIVDAYEEAPRAWRTPSKRGASGKAKKTSDSSDDVVDRIKEKGAEEKAASWIHADDLSSDDEDEDGVGNRIGRVPLHWYDDHDHVGYDVHGTKIGKGGDGDGGSDRLDLAIRQSDEIASGKYVIRDELNARDVTLTERQLELIRRVQGGAFAHPEFDAHPDYVDYYSGVDPMKSGINADRHEPKRRFQPSAFEKRQVRLLLRRLKCGSINMDFLEGKVRDMNDLIPKDKRKKADADTDAPFLLWKGDEEDELNLRKGPMHIAAPKPPPPGHAESYVPPDEYLPTEDDLKEWSELDPKDRPHGLLVPKKFPNLRSVGAYEHSVRERFERCLDLYLCPRAMKRRLNIDPESLVPSLPKPSDLRPFPTAKAVEYATPHADGTDPPAIRCLSPSPDGQFLASGGADGYARIWEVQTGRLLRSWDLGAIAKELEGDEEDEKGGDEDKEDADDGGDRPNAATKPVVSIQWNPHRSHHCLLAAVGKCAVVIAVGTGAVDDAELTESLLSASVNCEKGGNVANAKAAKAVKWIPLKDVASGETKPIGAYGGMAGPICALRTNSEMSSVRWHKKGDYFVTVSPKAGSASVLIHQLSKASSQKPFGKAKGEVQACTFHPTKPFLFVASQQHVRVYHLVKQTMAKRLLSGCKWISSLDVHPGGDHVVVGSLDRRLVWFDLDLSNTPYKTLKYHERALRSVGFHPRYPLMASSSDDGTIHVFHSTVYSDLMRNPLVVPVKVLRGHSVVNKLGVLSFAFHPTQPWLFSAGADGKIFLYQDI